MAPGVAADLIFHNATVLTMDPAFPVAHAVAIRGRRILAVGSNYDVLLRLRDRDTRIVNLKGRTILPGFNDAHGHWIGDRDRPLPGSTAQDAIAEALSRGYTSISEHFVSEERLAELRALDATGELRLRVNGYLPVNFHEDKFGLWFDGTYTPRQEYSDRLRIAGAKVFADRTAPFRMLLSEEHSDNPGYFGEDYWTQDELTDIVTELHEKGWQIAIHTVGDGAHDRVLNAFEAALDGASNTRFRHRIEHVMVVRDDQIQRIKRLGLIASIQLTFFQSDWLTGSHWPRLQSSLGPDRIGWAGRWRDLRNAGIRMIGSTDTPWFNEEFGPASPLEAVEMAVTKIGRNGDPPDTWLLAQRIRVTDALRMLTRDAAYATFDERRKGTVTPGKYADLVILGHNPLAVHPTELSEIPVLVTMVGGLAEFCAPAAGSVCP
jgi:predicted amidohydrolase YtcJ